MEHIKQDLESLYKEMRGLALLQHKGQFGAVVGLVQACEDVKRATQRLDEMIHTLSDEAPRVPASLAMNLSEASRKATDNPTVETKRWRQDLDYVLQQIKLPGSGRTSRERSLAITKLQEAIMWLGMDLKAQKEEGVSDLPNPYPSSYDPSNTTIEPTADGLKL